MCITDNESESVGAEYEYFSRYLKLATNNFHDSDFVVILCVVGILDACYTILNNSFIPWLLYNSKCTLNMIW